MIKKKYSNKLPGLSFDYPTDWELEYDSNVLSLYKLNGGVGALQFSAFKMQSVDGIDISKELNEYLVENGYSNVDVKMSGKYSYSKVKQGDRNWEFWLFLKNSFLIFASYNCHIDDIDKEKDEVKSIIESAL